ncbi:3-oxoacyl-[acyl-carrier-protein] reductase FabG [Halioglobus japonicus]|nr:3-oxoacyl-[acyl-carrier-protein] reductase FabG [Halioglobus japonicus]
MDLGLKGRNAIVCASSRGLGRACANSLVKEGCNVVINGRDSASLLATQEALSALGGGEVKAVCADINTAEGRQALLNACAEPDILVNNNAGPPPGNYSQWDEAAWLSALQANMLVPVLLIQAVVDGMRSRRFGRIVNITSAMVKSPHPAMGLSTSARSALTAFSKGLSKEVARDNVSINNMLPERFDTDRQEQMAQLAMSIQGITRDEARAQMAATIAANRLGQPNEFGDACAFLCSAQAGYISGQNLQLDGGSYDGLI